MRFSEFQNDLHHFKVTVRVKNDSGSMTVKTMVSAESMAQAQFLMRHVFGKDAVVSIVQVSMHESMAEGTKTLSPQELLRLSFSLGDLFVRHTTFLIVRALHPSYHI